MTEEETRILFSERQGYKNVRYDWINASDSIKDFIHDYAGKIMTGVPDPTDRNHVHAALMGMSEEEWWDFRAWMLPYLLKEPHLSSWSNQKEIIEATLKTPLPTLVSCYLEATKGRVK